MYHPPRIMDLKNKKKRKEKVTTRKNRGIGFNGFAAQEFGAVGNYVSSLCLRTYSRPEHMVVIQNS